MTSPPSKYRLGWFFGLLSGTSILTVATAASAVPCADLNLPNPIYGAGGSAITPTLALVATALANLDDPITVIWADPGACIGYQAFLDNAATTTFKYWDAAGVQQSCDPDLLGQPIDFAHMGNPADSCAGLTLPDDVGDFLGPVQTLNLITSVDSSETSISAEALYYIYGYGAQSEAPPWSVEANLAKRSSTSFVHLFLAESIGLSPEVFLGTQIGTNQESVDLVVAAAATDPDSTLGYVSGSNADKNRAVVKTLAYQHEGQSCGYWPDSDENAFDKINVRQGLYQLWTPGHFFARLDTSGEAENTAVGELISWFDGAEAPGGISVTDLVIEAGDIPGCAMTVTREGITGAISSYAPPQPCGCYFESVATGATSCAECSSDDDCEGAGEQCRYGFCEAY